MRSSTSRLALHERWRLAAIWAGVLTGPVVWLVLLEANYVLAYVACEAQSTWFMHLAVAGALLLVAGAGYAAWAASFGHTGAGEPPPPDRPRPSDETRRWMSLAGIASSGWFILVILAMEVPLVVLRVCQ
jgi:hypothetical protein